MSRTWMMSCLLLCTLTAGIPIARADEAGQSLLAISPETAAALKPSSGQVTAGADETGITVSVEPGPDGYPGITLTPGQPWNLSNYGHIVAKVVNTSDKAISVTLRVDGNGDWRENPWNAASTYLKPGAAGTIKVIFGYSFGKPGYKLDSSAVKQLLLFTGKANESRSFHIESIMAGGSPGEAPPVDPASIRIKPENGILFGPGVTMDPAKQFVAKNVNATVEDGQIKAVFTARAQGEQTLSIRPPAGRWDLRDYVEVRVTVRNDGDAPVLPRARVGSNKGATDWTDQGTPLAPGAVGEIVVPFGSRIWDPAVKDSGDQLASDVVGSVVVAARGEGERKLSILSIKAAITPDEVPDWLGKRPPVEGDWKLTFEDNFDGSEIDQTKWQLVGENYYDKKSHFSPRNVIVGDGFARLRFEKRSGYQNDDPSHKRHTEYATGYLDGYDRWVQRYGYFESRMKLPKAPGLWPAFWMMPERGNDADPQWKRQDTKFGGMEFDIMEHLTRWGPNRYSIAMHWDGYDKEHKTVGNDRIYFRPDKDGFITAGLLWTPGELVYYCNGREVARWKNDRIPSIPARMMFTLPMGGWDNSPLDDSQLPDDFVIDYVRVWQRADLASEVDGPLD